MHDSSFSEAEQQVLIALAELDQRREPADQAHLDQLKPDYFQRSAADWSQALPDLIAAGLVQEKNGVYALTPAGTTPGARLRAGHPPIYYFYRDFYLEAPRSRAHAAYCARVYGRDMCQHGYATLAQVDALIEIANLGFDNRVLDLGCGNGMITEYIFDRTGARVRGVDYMSIAIRQAAERTRSKRDRLTYAVGDMNWLLFSSGTFDTIIGIDALYFGDTDALIRRLRNMLLPGSQIITYYNQMLWDEHADRQRILPDQNDLGRVLVRRGLPFQAWDFTQAELERSKRSLAVLAGLKADFEAENNLFLYENRRVEAETNARFIAEGRFSRHLYRIDV